MQKTCKHGHGIAVETRLFIWFACPEACSITHLAAFRGETPKPTTIITAVAA